MVTVPAPAVERGERRSTGEFDLRGPARLLLGRDHEAEITLALPVGMPEESVRLSVSTGTIDLAKTGADGRLRARYLVPNSRWPQLALITATGLVPAKGSSAGAKGAAGASVARDAQARRVVDWFAVALVGQPRIEVRSEPRTRVEVEVAGATFGPVITNQNGVATLAVIAPPGVEQALMIAHDEVDNVKQTEIALETPPLRRATLLCPPALDREGHARIDVVVAAASGLPDGAPPSLSASGGRLDSALALVPGWYQINLDAGPNTDATPASITVRANPEQGSAPSLKPAPPEQCQVAVPAAPPVVASVARPAMARVDGAIAPPPTGTNKPRRTPIADIEVRLGYLTNFGKVSAPVLFGEAQYRLPWMDGAFALGLRAGGWWSRTSTTSQDGGQLTLDVSGLPALLHVHYRLPLPVVRVAIGAGGGVAWSWLHLDGSEGARAGRAVSGAASALLDLDLPLWRGALGVEVGYLYAPVDQPAIVGNLAGLHVTAGYRLEL